MSSVALANTGSTSAFVKMRDRSRYDVECVMQELSVNFHNKRPLDKAHFEKLQKICQDFQHNAHAFSTLNSKIEGRWINTRAGKNFVTGVKVTNVFLAIVVPILAAILTYYQTVPPTPSSPTPTDTSNNCTSIAPAPAPNENNFFANMIISLCAAAAGATILQGVLMFITQKTQDERDEFEKDRQELLHEALIERQEETFIKALEDFEKNKSREALNICVSNLQKTADSKLVLILGSIEKIVSNLLNRTDDDEIKEGLEQLHQKIQDDITDQNVSVRRRSSSRRKSRSHLSNSQSQSQTITGVQSHKHSKRLQAERGSAVDVTRRRSITVLTSETLDSINQFMTDLELPMTPNKVQIGEWWISEGGCVGRTEQELDTLNFRDTLSEQTPQLQVVIS